MLDLGLDIATWVLMLSGSFFVIITGVGLLRFPDIYSRIHAGGMADTLATFLIFSGLALQSGFTLVTVKLIFIVAFIFVTSPTSTYALAHATFIAGLKPLVDGFGDSSSEKSKNSGDKD